MKKLITVILFLSLFVSLSAQQKSTKLLDFDWKVKNTTTLERILWTEGAVIAYATADYFLYNLTKNSFPDLYKIYQGIMIAGANYILAKKLGLSSAVSFDIQCLFAVPDDVYYLYDGGSRGRWRSGGNEISAPNLGHLAFSPWYWIHGRPFKEKNLHHSTTIGISLGIIINL